jgi:hypothetical protein
VPVHAPIDAAELQRLCATATMLPASAAEADIADLIARPLPRRRFDNESLARISAASTVVQCECPHHLADLVSSLFAFELYSTECENRSPEDAALHAYLHATTAQARSLIEEALQKVIEAEGIEA